MILFVQIGDLGQSNLVAGILVLELVQNVLASPDNSNGIISAVSWVASKSIIIHTNKIWALVGTISWTRLDVVLSSVARDMHLAVVIVNVAATFMRVVLWVLLTIDEGNSVDIIIRIVVVVIFTIIPTHNEFFFGSLETYGSNWFCTIARNIDICHILILATSVLALNVSAAWVAKFTCGLNVRQEIVLLISRVI